MRRTLFPCVQYLMSSLSIRLGEEGSPLLEVLDGKIVGNIQDNIDFIQRLGEKLPVKLEIRIDKGKVLECLGVELDKFKYVFYFFSKNLLSLLRTPVTEIDNLLFKDPYTPTIIIVSDANSYISGIFINILGEKQYIDREFFIIATSSGVKRHVENFRDIARENLSWINFQLKNVTPLHFICSNRIQDSIDFYPSINNHLLTLTILYTANRSTRNDKGYESNYSNSEQTVTLAIDGDSFWEGENQTLYRVALWPYHGKDTDRLVIFQNVVARQIESESPPKNLELFKKQIGHLLDDARWHHRVYIEGQITKHFDQIEEVIHFVSNTTKEIGAAIDSVTKGLVESLLAVIGVVVLSVIASLLENKITKEFFPIVVRAYAIYLLAFQVVFRMGSVLHGYILTRHETEEQVQLFSSQLGEKRILSLTRPINRRNIQFWVWFILSMIIGTGIALSLLTFAGPMQNILLPSP